MQNVPDMLVSFEQYNNSYINDQSKNKLTAKVIFYIFKKLKLNINNSS